MRILAHGPSLRALPRLRRAVAGLALRGHRVTWAGAAPAGAAAPPVRRGWRAHHADVVVGGGRPVQVAAAGWLAGAHALVLGLGPGAAARWGAFDHWAWESLDALAIVEAADRDTAVAALDAERLVVWPEPEPGGEPEASAPETEALERACENRVARRHGPAPQPAVFLDRDGTLVVEKGYLADPAELELIPGAAAALRRLRAAGYRLVVISNQSGVGRGFYSIERVYATMARLREVLRESGVELDAIYFCPHRPDAGCACRKPGVELLREAARNLNLALRRSAMVGDKLLDVETGHRAGACGVLLRTGYGRDEEARIDPAAARPPDRVADDLEAAAAWLVERAEPPE